MNAAPAITKIDETQIRWITPTFSVMTIRTIEIYRGTTLYRTDTARTSSYVSITGLESGTYKIRYKVDSTDFDFSAFSNEVVLVPEMSRTPSITTFEPRVKDDGFAVVLITGINGAFVVARDPNDIEVASGTISNVDGTIQLGISNGGTYTFTQREDGKAFSIKTASITILPKENICVAITELKIVGSGTEVANSTRIYRTSYQGSEPTSVAWSRSGQGIEIISGGNSKDAEIKIGNSGGTISVAFMGCNGVLVSKDYIYEIGTTLPNCDNNSTSFFVGTVTYDKTANTLNYSFNANNLGTAIWNIKKGTQVVQSGSSTHNSNNKTITGINTLTAGDYIFELIGTSCSGTATKAFTVIAEPISLPSCNNGTSAFSIISIIHSSSANTLTYQFNASGLASATWKIKQGTAILGSGTVTHTSSVKTIATPILTTGTYTFELTGTTCDGVAVKTFSAVGTGLPPDVPPDTGATKKVTAMAKFADTGICSTNLIQFGYSNSASVVPTVFVDSNATKRVVNNSGVISEVQNGGTLYQSRDFLLPSGTYHFFSRQKTVITNITYEGVITFTA